MFYTDDHGTLDANCYGSKDLITPNIDRLAEEGVRFTQAYSHTVCCPSRAALMTGRHLQRSNINSWAQGRTWGNKGRNLALEETTLAEALKGAGYATALFGKWHIGAHPDHGPKKQGLMNSSAIDPGSSTIIITLADTALVPMICSKEPQRCFIVVCIIQI